MEVQSIKRDRKDGLTFFVTVSDKNTYSTVRINTFTTPTTASIMNRDIKVYINNDNHAFMSPADAILIEFAKKAVDAFRQTYKE
jgi:hypothetical protein